MTVLARSLLAAADSKRRRSEPEDRLTAIFAEVLMTSPALTSWLVEKAFGVPQSVAMKCCAYGDYEVDTRFSLAGGDRPDMRIRFIGNDRPPGGLFCENKIRAAFTARQRAGYMSVLESARVLVFSPGGDRRPNESPKFVPLSWSDLARAADRTGQMWRGLDWSEEAVRPDAPGQYRLLAELLLYLEREDVDVNITRPITDDDLDVLPSLNAVRARWREFRELLLNDLQRKRRPHVDLERRWDPESRGSERFAYSVTLRNGEGWEGADWPAMSRALAPPKSSWQELIVSPQAPWMGQGDPCVAVGVGLWKPPDWSDDMEDWNRLQEAIKGTGAWLGFTNRQKIYRVLRVRSLGEIIRGAEMLDAQAEAVVSWALIALDELVALESGE